MRSVPAAALVPLAAAVWWLVGFLPWILGGLGHDRYKATTIGLSAAPLSSASLGDLVLYSGVGGVVAGLTVLLGRGDRALLAAACAASGAVLAALVVLGQSRSAFGESDERLLNGLTLIGLLAALVGVGVGVLAATGRVGTGIALATLAGAAPIWVSRMIDARATEQHHLDWVGAAVLTAALVVIGLRPLTRVGWWPVAVVAAWFVAPLVTATSYFGGMLRTGVDQPGVLGENISASLDVLRMSASIDLRPLTPWIVAIVLAVGILWAHEVSTTRSDREQVGSDVTDPATS